MKIDAQREDPSTILTNVPQIVLQPPSIAEEEDMEKHLEYRPDSEETSKQERSESMTDPPSRAPKTPFQAGDDADDTSDTQATGDGKGESPKQDDVIEQKEKRKPSHSAASIAASTQQDPLHSQPPRRSKRVPKPSAKVRETYISTKER